MMALARAFCIRLVVYAAIGFVAQMLTVIALVRAHYSCIPPCAPYVTFRLEEAIAE